MRYAPIAVFAYNRPQHLLRTLNALKNNKEAVFSDLFIFLDGAKENNQNLIREVEIVAENCTGFASKKIIKRDKNIGLANNIISGINQVLKDYDRIIVLEDDLMPSPYFLQFMNDGLFVYESDEIVASIHGYRHPLKQPLPPLFFLKYPTSWGWATWRRAWLNFEPDGSKLLARLKEKRKTKEFDFNGNYRFTRMLQRQINGLNNSWAIRWYASVFLNDMLCLYPSESFIKDFGNDGSGENCFNDSIFDVELSEQKIEVDRINLEENRMVRAFYAEYFWHIDSLFSRIKIRIMRVLRKIKKDS